MKSIIRSKYYGIIRGVTVGIAFLLQIVTMVFLSLFLMKGFFVVYLLLDIISVITVFALVNNEEAYKFSWILIIMVLPVAGLFLYFMWGRKRTNSKDYRIIREMEKENSKYLVQNEEVEEDISRQHPNKVQISRYLRKKGFPIYNNTQVTYYPVGEEMIEAMLEDLRQAKEFIFMEYYIVNDGKVWRDILEILTQKVQEGVDVRLLFDDFGTLILNTHDFREDLKLRGIKLSIFNPIHRNVARLSFNYRNHQKIMVVDGDVGNFNVPIIKVNSIRREYSYLCDKFYDEVANKDDVTKMQYLDINMWLVGDILLKADKTSMANSLELRVPFLDREVMKIASSLPSKYRVDLSTTKIALRKAAEKSLPKANAERDKLGFPIPIRVWLKEERYYNNHL